MIQINQFVQKYSVRPESALTGAKFIQSNQVMLPKGAMIHYVTDTTADIAIRGSNPLIQNHDGDIRLSFITEGYGLLPGARKVAFNPSTAIKNFRTNQRRFRVIADPAKNIRADKHLGIMDYSLLTRMYVYQNNINKFYHSWANMAQAITTNIKEVGQQREQFLTVRLPKFLPQLEHYRKAEDGLTNAELQLWTDDGHFWLLEIYKMLHAKSEMLTGEAMDKLWIVFYDGAHSLILNAGNLRTRAEDNARTTTTQWLRLLDKLVEKRTGADTEALEKEVSDEEADKVDQTKEIIPGVPNSAAQQIADMGKAGRLSAAEQRRLITIAQRQTQLKNPFGDGTVGEMIDIKPEDIVLDPQLNVPVNDKVVPAHATKSAATAFTRDYVKNGLVERNTVRMLDHLKNGGLFISDMSMEPEKDAVNDANMLKLKLTPVRGKQSTVNILLHKFNEQGEFIADGVSYTMDAQWNDKRH